MWGVQACLAPAVSLSSCSLDSSETPRKSHQQREAGSVGGQAWGRRGRAHYKSRECHQGVTRRTLSLGLRLKGPQPPTWLTRAATQCKLVPSPAPHPACAPSRGAACSPHVRPVLSTCPELAAEPTLCASSRILALTYRHAQTRGAGRRAGLLGRGAGAQRFPCNSGARVPPRDHFRAVRAFLVKKRAPGAQKRILGDKNVIFENKSESR